ncbi:hypothetical protein ACLOJK_026947 [Asimina triloba]
MDLEKKVQAYQNCVFGVLNSKAFKTEMLLLEKNPTEFANRILLGTLSVGWNLCTLNRNTIRSNSTAVRGNSTAVRGNRNVVASE